MSEGLWIWLNLALITLVPAVLGLWLGYEIGRRRALQVHVPPAPPVPAPRVSLTIDAALVLSALESHDLIAVPRGAEFNARRRDH